MNEVKCRRIITADASDMNCLFRNRKLLNPKIILFVLTEAID